MNPLKQTYCPIFLVITLGVIFSNVPFFFVIDMEYLSRLLKKLISHLKFKFHPRCEKVKAIQFCFADDSLIFCKREVSSVQLLFECFNEFSQASGLIANLDKSSTYFCEVNENIQTSI